MPGCTVPNCSNSIEKGFKLFHFPSNHERRALWAKKCGRDKDWKPTRNICICEVHFEESQFELNADNLRKLKPNAVPTVFNDAIPAFYRREKSNGEHENTNHTPVTQVTLKQRKNDTNITTLPSDVSPNVSKKTKLENNIKKGENEKMGRNVSTDVSSVTHTVHKSQLNNQISSSKDVKTKTGLDEHTSLLSKNLSGSVSQITDSENEKTNQAPGLQISMRHRKKDKNNSTIHINVSPSGTKNTNQTQGLQKTLRQTRNDKNTLSADVPTIVSKKTTGQRKKVKNTTTKSTDVPPCVLKVRKLIKDYEKSKNRKKNSNVSTHVSSITRTLNKSARNKQIPVSKDFEATVSKKKTEKHDGSFIKASSYHVSGTSDQKNENTNQAQELQRTSRHMKNDKNTTTLPADLSTSISKKRKLERNTKRKRREERNRNLSTDVSSITHTVHKSQIKNKISLTKEIKIILPKIQMGKHSSLLIKDSSQHISETSDLANETREDLQSSNGENICFVCNSRNQNIVPNNACTETSKTELKQKLVLLVSVELDLRLEDIGLICVNCAQILNCIDYVENMHKTLSKGILNHVKRNFGMEPTEHVNLDLCMRQIQAQSEAKIKYVGNLRGPAQSSI